MELMFLFSDIFYGNRLAQKIDMKRLAVLQAINPEGTASEGITGAVKRGARNTACGIGDFVRNTKNVDLGFAVEQVLNHAAAKAEIDHFNRRFDSLSEEEQEELANDDEKFEQFVRDVNAELGIYDDDDEDEEDDDDEDEDEEDEEEDDRDEDEDDDEDYDEDEDDDDDEDEDGEDEDEDEDGDEEEDENDADEDAHIPAGYFRRLIRRENGSDPTENQEEDRAGESQRTEQQRAMGGTNGIFRSFWEDYGEPDVETDTADVSKSGGASKEQEEKEHLTDERLSRTLRYLSGALAGKVPGYLSDLTALAVLYETGQITLEQVYENMPPQEGADASEMVGILNLISLTLCGKPVNGTVGRPKAKASEKLNSAVLSVLERMRGYQKILTEDSAKKLDGMMEALQKQKKEKQEKQ